MSANSGDARLPPEDRKLKNFVWVNALALGSNRISCWEENLLSCLWVGFSDEYCPKAALAGEFTPRFVCAFRMQLESDICICMRGGVQRGNSNRGLIIVFPVDAPICDQPAAGPTLITQIRSPHCRCQIRFGSESYQMTQKKGPTAKSRSEMKMVKSNASRSKKCRRLHQTLTAKMS